MLKKLLIAVLLAAALPASAHALKQVGYEGEIKAKEPLSVTVDSDGSIYFSQNDGTLVALGPDGKQKFVLGGKDKKWKDILHEPKGVALSGDRIYTVDADLGRIVVFSKTGEYIESIGTKGSEPRQFSEPSGIALFKGIIYVADTGNSRVQVIGQNGVYLGSIGTIGTASDLEAKIKKPCDVKVDHRGYIYVVDQGDRFLKVYKQDGSYLQRIQGVRNPTAVEIDRSGIYVSDVERFSILRFDFEFKPDLSFGTKGTGRAQFESIAGIASQDGKVFVTDVKRGILQVFKPEKEDMTATAIAVPPPTSVQWVGNIAFGLDNIAWDPKKGVLYGIDPKKKAVIAIKDGKLLKEIVIPKAKPISVAPASDGGLWVLDDDKKLVYKLKEDYSVEYSFGGSGSREGYFSGPSDIAVSGTGEIYVADTDNKRIQVFSSDGIFIGVLGKGGTEGLLQGPIDLAFDNSNILYVLDGRKKAVLIFATNGMVVKEVGGKTPEGKDTFDKPIAIAVTDDELFVLEGGGPSIIVYNKQGERIREFGSPVGDKKNPGRGEFMEPSSMVARDRVRLFISDPDAGRLQELANVYSPSAPKGVGARGGTRSATLYWDASTEAYVEQYVLLRADAAEGPYNEVARPERTSYVDSGLEPDRKYYYKIAAVARDGNEGWLSPSVEASPVKLTASAPKGFKAIPQEWSVELKWDKNGEDHIDYYLIYQEEKGEIKEAGKTQENTFVAGSLEPDKEYVLYLSAVSSDQVESEKVSLKVRTQIATRPPIEIDVVKMEDIFSNTYKNYETEGVGRIKVVNNTMSKISRLKVNFTIKDFMDFPSEAEIKDLPPRGEAEIDLKAVFNNRILEVAEDTPVQTEIKVSYYANQDLKTYSRGQAINIFEKHKMKWDVRERMAAFVTTKDPVVLDFTRGIITQYRDTSEPLLFASVVFDALGVHGMTYIIDPSNPYQVRSKDVETVDFLQYPRESLKRKSGDCDDLVILYSAALESIGMHTMVLDIPGHMFMMFEIGSVEDLGTDTFNNMFVIHEGSVWIPIEATLVGKTFMKAWEEGSRKYYQYKVKNQVGVMDLHEAWTKFKPANLPAFDWQPAPIAREVIEKKFNDEFKILRQIRVKIRSKKFIHALEENPKDINAYIQLGIVYAESGETGEAQKSFQRAIEIEPGNAVVHNNLGNLYFMDGLYGKARKSYEDSIAADPRDPYVWVNLARTLVRLELKKEAKDAFSEAYRIDPAVANKYRGLSLQLLGPI